PQKVREATPVGNPDLFGPRRSERVKADPGGPLRTSLLRLLARLPASARVPYGTRRDLRQPESPDRLGCGRRYPRMLRYRQPPDLDPPAPTADRRRPLAETHRQVPQRGIL